MSRFVGRLAVAERNASRLRTGSAPRARQCWHRFPTLRARLHGHRRPRERSEHIRRLPRRRSMSRRPAPPSSRRRMACMQSGHLQFHREISLALAEPSSRTFNPMPSSPSALEISASVAVDFQADGHFDDLRLFPGLTHLCSSLRLNNPIMAQEKAHGNWRRRQYPSCCRSPAPSRPDRGGRDTDRTRSRTWHADLRRLRWAPPGCSSGSSWRPAPAR